MDIIIVESRKSNIIPTSGIKAHNFSKPYVTRERERERIQNMNTGTGKVLATTQQLS